MKHFLSKLLVLLVFVTVIFASSSTAYSYFDVLTSDDSETIPVGEWYIGLSTAQEFYDFATKTDSVAEDRYYLTNDIDFTGFTWELDAVNNMATFKGVFDGDGHTLSNLTIYSDSTTYTNIGIFPIINGGTVKNLVLDTVEISLGPNALNATTFRGGVLTGEIINTSVISNITLIDCASRSNRGVGSAGIVGYIRGTSTNVTIDNIKATGLRVFNSAANPGGIVGQINKNVPQVTITNVDIQTEVFSFSTSSNVGGLVGKVEIGAGLTIENAIVEITTTQNTLETSQDYLSYSKKYLGGFVGYNQSDITISNSFFTGELITNGSAKGDNVGTAIARNDGTYVLDGTYYSMVEFRQADGSIDYVPQNNSTGEFATLVNQSSMPSNSWWNTFATDFDSSIWDQDTSGRLYLIR